MAEELRNQWDMAFDKTEKMCAKLKQAVDNRNERLVNKTQQDMGEQFRTF